jgi:hypothetical protein
MLPWLGDLGCVWILMGCNYFSPLLVVLLNS